ncbi:class I SAM-dependent methyltransferase, partial [Fulvivirga sp. RKSG066]|uniref:class I SAM-dependent methyltransferase n=1 Tax=Fulvivirga aurantia TaxID=2529383 RepID=UPI0012BD1D50
MRFSILIILLVIAQGCETRNTKQTIPTAAKKDTANAIKPAPAEAFNLDSFQKLVEQYEAPDRAKWQNPELVIDKLGIVEGKVIADIGAGSGYFTFRLAQKGASVVAIDIDDRFLEHIENRKAELNNINPELVTTRLSTEEDPLLESEELDVALLV